MPPRLAAPHLTSLPTRQQVALYHVADVCIVTSLRDGMNLVSYEYVACQVGVYSDTH